MYLAGVPKLRLEFWRFGDASPGPDIYHLIIDGPFRLTASDDSVEVDPAAGPDPTCLVDKTVGRAIAFRDGSLSGWQVKAGGGPPRYTTGLPLRPVWR
jgi:hypothetical protein